MADITRRDFIKAGLIFLSTSALIPPVFARATDSKNLDTNKDSGTLFDTAIPTTCLICGAGCGIIAYKRHGRVVKIDGNPLHPTNRGKICGKGHAGLNILYDPERVLSPLMRKGPRGSGNWRVCTWSEIMDGICERIQSALKNGDEILFLQGSDRMGNLVEDISRKLGRIKFLASKEQRGINKRMAYLTTFDTDIVIPDIEQSTFILNFGANPFEANYMTPLAQRIINAKIERGARLITIDPRLSNTAAKSDLWIPIKPGTDGIVSLSMSFMIMNNDLHDREFIRNCTNCDEKHLLAHLSKYTPELAERVSGVDRNLIRKIAFQFATSESPIAISGRGVYQHLNGIEAERSVLLLNIICGRINKKGGLFIFERSRNNRETIFSKKGSSGNESFLDIIEDARRKGKKYPVIIIHHSNPVYSQNEINLISETLRDEKLFPFIIVSDTHITETAMFADVVLPDTSYLECWGITERPVFGKDPYISLSQPVSDPPGEAIPFEDVFIQIANRVGISTDFKDSREFINRKIGMLLRNEKAKSELYENGFLYLANRENLLRVSTVSKKIEIHSEKMKEFGLEPFPSFKSPSEKKPGWFYLITYKINTHSHSRTQNCKWLSEIFHTNPLLINPLTAEKLGIKEGDTVKLKTELGSVSVKVQFTEGIHPDALAIAMHAGHWAYGRVARAIPFKSNDPDTMLIWWTAKGNGINPNRILHSTHPSGGEHPFLDALVYLDVSSGG